MVCGTTEVSEIAIRSGVWRASPWGGQAIGMGGQR